MHITQLSDLLMFLNFQMYSRKDEILVSVDAASTVFGGLVLVILSK